MLVFGVMALAAVPRAVDLGQPGLTANEDYAMLCARAILDQGLPVLPSGGFYPRALPFSYATAAMIGFFGESERALRLIPALFSIGTVGLAYLLAKRVFGSAPAIVAGVILALSPWEIVFGRTARMYSALSFLFLFALYATYRVAFESAERWRLPAIAAGVGACVLHQLGAVLVLPYAVLLAVRRPSSHRPFIVASIAIVTLTSAGVVVFEKHHYAAFHDRVAAANSHDVSTATSSQLGLSESAEGDAGASRQDRRPLPRPAPMTVILAAGISAVAAGTAWKVTRDAAFTSAVVVSAMLIGLQQATLAAYVAAAYYALGLVTQHPASLRKIFGIVSVVAAGSTAWLVVGVVNSGASRVTAVARNLLEYPPNFLEFYLRLYPGMFVVVAGSVCGLVAGAVRDRRANAPHLFLACAFLLPAVGLGFHPDASRLFNERYVFHLNTAFVLLYSYGLWQCAAWVGKGRVSIAVIVASVLAVMTGGVSAAKTWAAANPRYGENTSLRSAWGESRFIADHRGSSLYACENARPGDLVVPMDVLNHWTYCSRADFQLTLSTKGDAEGWIGIRSGDSIGEIHGALSRAGGQRVWIVLSGYELTRGTSNRRLDGMLAFRTWDCASKVYNGRDGASDVWVLDRSCLEQHLP